MARAQPQILIRIPSALKAAIQAAAASNQRSVNAEITSTLERVYLPVLKQSTESSQNSDSLDAMAA